jgi:hypothetical protein
MKLPTISAAIALSVVACQDPKIPLNENTTQICWDGSKCPTWQACPNYSTPGKCEMGDPPPMPEYKRDPYDSDGGR